VTTSRPAAARIAALHRYRFGPAGNARPLQVGLSMNATIDTRSAVN